MAQKSKGALVQDYMTTQMATISQNKSVLDVAKKMVKGPISSVAITDNSDKIIGILTERDIVKVVANGIPPDGVTTSSLMTQPLVSISKDSSLEEAARFMALKKIRHLLVRDIHSQVVVGIVSLTDLARYIRHTVPAEQTLSSEVWELFF